MHTGIITHVIILIITHNIITPIIIQFVIMHIITHIYDVITYFGPHL